MFGSKLIIRNCSIFIPKCRLNNRVAIVTGGTCGLVFHSITLKKNYTTFCYSIGLAIARRLGQEGAKVVICSRNTKNLCQAINTLECERISVTGVECNVTLAKHRKSLIQEALCKFGTIDIVVSNAGTDTPKLSPIMSVKSTKILPNRN